MNRLDEGVRATLSKTILDKLQLVFTDMAEEEKTKQQVMRVTLEKLMEDTKELEASMEIEKENWERERENLVESADAARHEEWIKKRDDVSRMQFRLNMAMEDREKEREKRLAVEREHKHILSRLAVTAEDKTMAEESEQATKDAATWERLSRERENGTLSMVLAAAAAKQRLLKELKAKTQKWMGAQNMATEEVNRSQEKLLDNWRKLQDGKPCPNDDLQVHEHTMEMKGILLQNQTLLGKIAMKFGKRRESLMAEFVKKEEELMAAELKKRRKLEEKMRKELEKIQKAELKEQKRREAKMKKEDEKLAKKKAAEDGTENRQPRFCFW
ncbi:hypothetical protein ACEWY4_003729 [Coilia grayii]|uniref:Trichohyalin-plectin-homology domain-containing protein n=1 Tax=Coilia grayii TaxID=363190 RepID=A0ABD1KS18_9TELE